MALNGETYKERKETSKICYGKIPPPPPPIKKGDKVSRYLYGETYEGIVMNKKGEKFQVMWTKKVQEIEKTIDEKNKLDEYQKKMKITGINYNLVGMEYMLSIIEIYLVIHLIILGLVIKI